MAIQLTPKAAQRINRQIQERGSGIALRLGYKPTGCSGYAYTLDYADKAAENEQLFESHGAKVLVRREQLPLLDGLTVDFRREGINEVFKFENPNADALCGCGESFSVGKTGT